MQSSDNKRIVKNTLFLYSRMFLTIMVNLYVVRIVWQVLGVEDYGVYNVVGGIVTMFAFLNNAMISSSQRFISFELGTGNMEKLHKVFNISVSVHLLLALCVLILAETAGLWFLNERLNIPEQRMYAANWVYQCSVLSFIITIISVPYNACIVAHEHMKAYGYFGILEVILRLMIVFLLIFIHFDKLITYAVLIVCVSGLMRLVYGVYCRQNFKECRFRFTTDHHLLKDMFSFAGWSFIGNLGFSVRDQGLNIIVNLFFNVAVNAAKGIASQVGGVVNGFSQNFQMALNPQITKCYASGNTDNVLKLVFAGCKYSVILVMFIVIPLFFASEQILTLWIGDVAPYTVGFMRLILIMILIDSMVGPITTALQATGRIKWFQIIMSTIMLSNIPLAWTWLKIDSTPYIVIFVSIITSIIALAARLILLHHEIPYSYLSFYRRVILRLAPIIILSFAISGGLFVVMNNNLLQLLIFLILSLITIGVLSFNIGLENNERLLVIEYVRKRIKI